MSKKERDEQMLSTEEQHKLLEEREEYLNLAKRTQADFVNYRNRMENEKKEWIRYGENQLIIDLLGLADNFGQAAKHVPEDLKDNQWVQGIQNIERQLEDLLKNKGIERLDCLGQDFDPGCHEACFYEESDAPADTVTEVYSEGYKRGDKVIRPAKVKVSKGK